MDYMPGNGGEGGFKDNLMIRFWLVELDGWWYHPWIRKHWKRAEDEAGITTASWFSTCWLHVTACYRVLEDTAHILFVCMCVVGGDAPCLFGVYLGHLRQWSLRWEWAGSQEVPLCSHFRASFGAMSKELPQDSITSSLKRAVVSSAQTSLPGG